MLMGSWSALLTFGNALSLWAESQWPRKKAAWLMHETGSTRL